MNRVGKVIVFFIVGKGVGMRDVFDKTW